MTERRKTTDSDWKKIDAFFNAAQNALDNNEITREEHRMWLTHMVGLANNEGIDAVIKALDHKLAENPIKWRM